MKLIEPLVDRVKTKKLKRAQRAFHLETQKDWDRLEYFEEDTDKFPCYLEGRSGYYWREIAILETKRLRPLADKWGIRLEKNWLEVIYNDHRQEFFILSDEAREAITAQVKVKRRENIDWWVTKVIVPLMGALTGLMGVITALLALKYKK